MSTASVIWLLDDREIRRAAISGFLTIWAHQSAIDIRPVDSVEAIPPRAAEDDMAPPELCILVVGGTSLADPDLSPRVRALVSVLAGRPLAILSDIDTPHEVSLAIELGADGLLTTNIATSVAVAALNFILTGGTYFKRSSLIGMCEKLANADIRSDRFGPAAPDQAAGHYRFGSKPRSERTDVPHFDPAGHQPILTQRQKEIVEMLKLGRSNKEIARMLDISDATVKIFVRQVMKKYGAINRTQVALLASDAMSQMDIINTRHLSPPPPLQPEP